MAREARAVHRQQVRDDHAHAGGRRVAPREGIAANCLWPRTYIATAAVANIVGGDAGLAGTRTPAIVADAAYEILTRPAGECTGNTFIDDEVLTAAGVTDLEQYRDGDPGEYLALDIFM